MEVEDYKLTEGEKAYFRKEIVLAIMAQMPVSSGYTLKEIITRANQIEDYIVNGKKDT